MSTQAPTEGPKLVLVSGSDAGRVFRLREPAPDDGWSLGRDTSASLRLSEDPYVASRHARIVEREGSHVLVAHARTFHNWRLMEPGAEAALAMGDLVGLGMTMLVYQPG